MDRVILHIDMDAFFASVEQRDNKRLLKKPVAVVGSNARTVLVSPSYEARRFGVKTGMTKYRAKSLCPGIVFVTANTGKYTSACGKIAGILYGFTPDIEIYSIDEFFLDITNTMHLFGTAEEIAQKAQSAISRELALNCSIGISHNKLLAKFASEKAKPAGVYYLKKDDVAPVFKYTRTESLCGIGKKTARRLSLMGIETLGQLKEFDSAELKRVFGINGTCLSLMARGIDNSPVRPFNAEDRIKSMGHSATFKQDSSDIKVLSRELLELADKVGRRLRKAGLSAGTVKLTIRYKSFKTFTRQKSLPSSTDDTKDIYMAARNILLKAGIREPVRLLGITGAKLSASSGPISLFSQENKRYRINKVLDYVNERFDGTALSFASLLENNKYDKVISPAWRPSGNRNY